MGDCGSGVCQRGGLDQLPETRVSSRKRKGGPWSRTQKARRQQLLEEETSLPQEGQSERGERRMSEPEANGLVSGRKSAGDVLCSGLGSGKPLTFLARLPVLRLLLLPAHLRMAAFVMTAESLGRSWRSFPLGPGHR